MFRRYIYILCGIVLILGLLVTGCTASDQSPQQQPQQPQEPEKPAPGLSATPAPSVPSPTAPAPGGPSGWQDMLPENLALTTYDIGGGSHLVTAANAEAIFRVLGQRVRIIPASSDAARVYPLTTGDAQFMMVTSGVAVSALQGTGSTFSKSEWGPQPMRAAWFANRSTAGWAVKPDSDIQSFADVKGKKIAINIGSGTSTLVAKALLAYAGLTEDDIEWIQYPNNTGTERAIARGEADVGLMWFADPPVREVHMASGFRVLQMPADDTAAWERAWEVAPWFYSVTLDDDVTAAGASKENPYQVGASAQAYHTFATVPDDVVYAFCHAMVETIEEAGELHRRCLEASLEVQLPGTWSGPEPWHPGAVKFFKEMGVWNAEEESAWQAKMAALGQ
ncbi:TAXI family TRAP transporter solute-binding subunit [Chloroflexota bacterium]